jgi:hypothetical protein
MLVLYSRKYYLLFHIDYFILIIFIEPNPLGDN